MTDTASDKASARLRELVTGSVPAPNEFVAYHVKRVQAAQAESESLAEAITKSTRQLSTLRERALMARAKLEAHIQSITEWENKTDAVQTSEPSRL